MRQKKPKSLTQFYKIFQNTIKRWRKREIEAEFNYSRTTQSSNLRIVWLLNMQLGFTLPLYFEILKRSSRVLYHILCRKLRKTMDWKCTSRFVSYQLKSWCYLILTLVLYNIIFDLMILHYIWNYYTLYLVL